MSVDTDILPPRYRSPKRIALGGMGEVYRATDSVLGRAVAVKLLAERYSRDGAVRGRFTREALAAARLSGEPNIVTVFDVGEYAERPFIVMEYLSGGSLEERIQKDGAQEVGQSLEWLEAAAAVAHVNAPVPSIAEICEGLPEELDAVFRQALAKDPEQRFETASEFVAALRAALAEAAGTTRSFRPTPSAAPSLSVLSPVTRRRVRRSRWPALVALLALGAVGGAIAAIVLTNGDNKPKAAPPSQPRTVTVTNQASTVQTTVTSPTTAPPPPPAPASSSLSGSALNDAGFTKMQAGDYTGALPLLQQAVTKLSGVGFPNEAYANYNLGYTLLQLGSCSEAVPYLERAQQLEPHRHEPKDALKRTKHC